uniref:Uncharacterized protein n=1 Tax=Anopheles funestus TaxID=62324 RepID=A0A4Y0BDE4_ANOFN
MNHLRSLYWIFAAAVLVLVTTVLAMPVAPDYSHGNTDDGVGGDEGSGVGVTTDPPRSPVSGIGSVDPQILLTSLLLGGGKM